ncbi:DUF2760 domain-containing protein [Corallincola holothuriorum]|uniref:DUF2760 domain-containing protein n=1 Tax=Corallincola holothuriorum TaxID=2282215 RepID=A0A368NHV5_9GAMM|nr:DUF2760 domain-containing protein [Corallincola holothuriorum]RCU49224.1 DUF2760 domain-containing protein [Corallincola holothuriorum]
MQTHFFARIALAFKVIFSRRFTDTLVASSAAESETAPAVEPAVTLTSSNSDGALQMLALLQKEGRLLDFIQEDVTSFSDEQVGAAARVVHQGLKKTISEHVTLAPITTSLEGNPITVPEGFDPQAYRLTGNVSGSAPFHGTLLHKGWKANAINLPQTIEGYDFNVLAAAEVEL